MKFPSFIVLLFYLFFFVPLASAQEECTVGVAVGKTPSETANLMRKILNG